MFVRVVDAKSDTMSSKQPIDVIDKPGFVAEFECRTECRAAALTGKLPVSGVSHLKNGGNW